MADEHSPTTTTTPAARSRERPSWTLLTNHGHVLLAVARGGDVRISDIAARVGITERATLMILKDLEDGGCITRRKTGRRTQYTVDEHQHFRHPTLSTHEVGELLAVLGRASDPELSMAGEDTTGPAERRAPGRGEEPGA
jgi:DNA-binding MarR family transcriptional regulator